MFRLLLFPLIVSFSSLSLSAQVRWKHISGKTGAPEVPNAGKQQTSATIGDFNNDGINDFCISERIDLHDSEILNLDGDGDLDIPGKQYDDDAPRLDICLQN